MFACIRRAQIAIIAIERAGAFADAGGTRIARCAETPVRTWQGGWFVSTAGFCVTSVVCARIFVVAHHGSRPGTNAVDAGFALCTRVSVVAISA